MGRAGCSFATALLVAAVLLAGCGRSEPDAAAEVEACEWEAGRKDVRSTPVPDASAALAAGLPEGVSVSVRAEVATDSGSREVTATRVVLRSGRQLLVLHAAGVSQEQALAMVPAVIVR